MPKKQKSVHLNDQIYPLQDSRVDPIKEKLVALVWEHFNFPDSQGIPYAFHKLRVGQRAYHIALNATKDSKLAQNAEYVGLSHDFIEDIKIFLKNPHLLVECGLPEHLLPSVLSVTHTKNEKYTDAIQKAKADPIGRYVKMADITDNSTLSRFLISPELSRFINPVEKGARRHLKYFFSYLYLSDQLTLEEYLNQIAQWKLQ